MKIGTYTIQANMGKVLDCTAVVGVECDGETIAFRFPQIEQDDDNLGPMVYACVNGTTLHVRLCGRDDEEIDIVWDEGLDKWRLIQEKKGGEG